MSEKNNNFSKLIKAVQDNDIETVKELLPLTDPKKYKSMALRAAAARRNPEMVRLLIPVSDPKANNSEALRRATYDNYTDIVKMLIPVSDPKANNNDALKLAVRTNKKNIVDLLYDVSNIKDVVEYIEKDEIHNEASEYFYARKNSLKTKETLKRNISISTNNKSRQYKM